MTVREFVAYLYDNAEDTNVLHDIQTATEDLEHLRREGFEVPEDITPEKYADTWNELVLASCENVRVLNGSGNLVTVPRHTQMTNKQIAKAIKNASDWSDVRDLVDYVDEEYLHIEKDDDGYFQGDWERIIEDWCDEQ